MEHILKSIYSRKNWVELVHDIFGNSYKVLKNPLVEKADNHIAVAALCLGKIELSDGNVIAVYETQLQPNIQLSRNKVGIRNLLRNSWKLYDGALIGSYIEGSDEWRFSYISETKGFDAEGNYGNLKTQPKRFTYLFGKQHPCRTAKQRFGDLMNSEKTLENIKDAFSVEALSDEFFKDYKQQYEKFCTFVYLHKTNTDFFGKEFAAYDDKTVRDYVKKMLGRIVFLNFLQKKGWLGVPAQNKDWTGGDLNFMRSLYVNANDYQRDKFLDLVLEPLFFNCLNEKRAADLFDTKIERIGKVKIPYLNGGLFEKDAIDKPDSNFPADYFANLFDLFSQYNFTIDENDPNDAEVGVDPEMLGKIFENLLEDNKDKGAFYTPKEIVQYMCRESLIAYLTERCREGVHTVSTDTNENAIRAFVQTHQLSETISANSLNTLHNALCNVKICDPAIGSGAFPMGLLNELFACRMALNGKDGVHTVSTDNAAKIKRQIIQNNIYGVDIEKGAVDIARLRFWLALVVDETEPQPLPNLDYKIMQGNSLLESYEGVDLSNIMQSDDMFVNKAAEGLGSKLEEYYNEDNHTTKAKLRAEIDNIVKNSIKAANPQVGDIEIPNDKFFLWHTYFADVFNPATDCNASGGFDIVIGNPPYGANIDALTKIYEKKYPKTSHGYKDIYKYFFDQGFRLLVDNGTLSFITPNTVMRQPRYGDLRKLLLEHEILQLLDLGENIFDPAVVPVAITLAHKQASIETHCTSFVDLTKIITKENAGKILDIVKFKQIQQSLFTETQNNIFIENIRQKKENEFLLENVLEMKDAGFKYQRSNVGMSQKGKNDLADRIFYCEDKQNPKDISILIGKDINEYCYNLYPTKNLRHDYERLLRTNEGTYYNKKIMSEPKKLIWRQTAPYFIGTILDNPLFFGNTIQAGIIKPEFTDKLSYEYLCGLLNSKYLRYLYEQNVKEEGRVFPQVKLEKLKPLPIIITENQQPIIALVEKILAAKRQNPQADTTAQEAEIDKLVYELYGLGEEEIKVVEGI